MATADNGLPSSGTQQRHTGGTVAPRLSPCCSRLLLALGGLAAALPAWAQLPAGFDLDMLRERGIDPQIAEYFKDAARFRPGINIVTLFVNGQMRGRVDARFDDKGELCFDKNLLNKGGLKTPEKTLPAGGPAPASAAAAAAGQCYDFKDAYPQTGIELRPGKEEVALVVPTDAMRPNESDFSGFTTGGTAALVNYDIVTSRSQFGSSSSNFLSANLEYGFNTRDWIVRGRTMYARQDQSSQRQHLYAYAQHTLVDYKSIFQGGQINILNTAFAAGPITGLQIVPETALSSSSLNNVMVEGIAQTQARVEVRQNNALIYSTVVPSGPFALTDLPLLNGTSDLDVTVTEANGSQRRFTVPAASLHGGNLGMQRGYSFALGKLRSLGNSTGRQPWVATAGGGWPLGKNSTLSAGLMGATGYQAASWGADTRIGDNNLSVQQRLSRAPREGEHGTQFTLASSSILAANTSLGLSTTQQTLGYRDLSDTTIDQRNELTEQLLLAPGQTPTTQYARYRGQYTASLSWSNTLLGGFNVSYSRSTQFYGQSTQRVMASWGRSFDTVSVNLNIEHQMGGTGALTGAANTFYLTVSIPLGKRSVRTYVNNSSGYQRLGASYNEQLNDYVNYTVAAERNQQTKDSDLSTQVSMLPRYAQVNLGYARYGSGSTAYNGGLRGAMVLHQAGLTLSPYAVQDTFGILQVGDVSGVKVSTPYGPVWTDWKGQAVVSQLPPYASTRLEIATKSLPRNVDIKNGLKLLDPGRGSVSHIDFDVLKVRRILLNTKSPDGQPLPKGAFVLDADNRFVTTVVDDGQVFLLNGTPTGPLRVTLPDEKNCVLQYSLPSAPDPNMFYETADAVCRPDMHAQPKGIPHAPV
ncbi:fimbria/pilus outer membrane usher protein [Herbaspirillum chlorophenolicum]|uniref:fimbria/pilus outer membrane usher protein n=1 Tax=Herbaspirillum chlorophenolicum TaxID=211589 RepID=UPI000B10D79F|nr:fimbria/pilus outer membrane usher protein [Herbaspirillum chlorophenolicum]